jgi:hypothetical protein
VTEQYIGWALVVGGVLGGALVWFIVGRLPRKTEDVPPAERREEASWISRVIESRGGVAPPALVDEVLELHAEYLAGPALDVRPQPGEGREPTRGDGGPVDDDPRRPMDGVRPAPAMAGDQPDDVTDGRLTQRPGLWRTPVAPDPTAQPEASAATEEPGRVASELADEDRERV